MCLVQRCQAGSRSPMVAGPQNCERRNFWRWRHVSLDLLFKRRFGSAVAMQSFSVVQRLQRLNKQEYAGDFLKISQSILYRILSVLFSCHTHFESSVESAYLSCRKPV